MARPVASDVTEDIFGSLGPFAKDDGEATAWHLLKFIEALAGPFVFLDALIADEGSVPGWANLFSPATAPAWLLPHSGQYVGVTVPEGMAEADARTRITDEAGWRRGRIDSIINALKAVMTGTKIVNYVERYTSAYTLYVQTYSAQVPDTAAFQEILDTVVPGGIVVTWYNQPGVSIDELVGTIDAQVGTIDNYITVTP